MTLVLAATLAGIVLVLAGSAVAGTVRPRRFGGASEFYVAGRAVTPWSNAAAIGSEYVSAAAFLGLAGLVVAYGADMLWYPIGAAAGYVVLIALVTAPLRRSGTYTLSNFAEWRLGSFPVRRLVTFFVVFVGLVYLLPQIHGAGLTLRLLVGAPLWVGWVLVCAVVLVVSVAGGMRSITRVQALQFWLKLGALVFCALVLFFVWRADGSPLPAAGNVPVFPKATEVVLDTRTEVGVAQRVEVNVVGTLDGQYYGGSSVTLTPGDHVFAAGTRVMFAAGAAVPHIKGDDPEPGELWATPYSGARDDSWFDTISVLVAAVLGTMGLPHVLVRFYTNTDGAAARRTVVIVLGFVGLFYLLPPLYGVLGRLYAPEVLMTGRTDETMLLLPVRMIEGPLGEVLAGVLAAGAFAAFLATSSGIVVALAGTLSTYLLGGGVASFRTAAAGVLAVALGLAAVVDPVGSPLLVMLVFAVSAATLCPLLVLGIWWRRLSTAGVAAGLVSGGGLSVAAVILGWLDPPWLQGRWTSLMQHPALITVPVAFAVMVGVSLLTPGRVPPGVGRMMALLHVPEGRATYPSDRSSREDDRSP
ncbi:cation acetate symporter [Bailinhaonella thermotolerans]|uniref:Cation acetate symporter n=1 Tax=Bailinhaonella thermotolerans TaxID=1070861 RepID=A0A3A4B024_9ACTN|nr:cation acetate symporter [Bailinhaonella thermotolerans]RJL31387.1 cation acetate symporter [Bailinhaonella thermotolerans]